VTCRDLLYLAFREARVLKRPQGVNSDSELQDGLLFLNQLIDYWSARGCYAWTSIMELFALTPGHQPHLIGPGLAAPDFNVKVRPVSIRSANIVLAGNPSTDIPVSLRDSAWWAGVAVKDMQSTIPTDLHYNAAVPAGQLWFWPVPSAGHSVRLEADVMLDQFRTLNDPFVAPPAYASALALTLAEELVDIWGTEMPMNLARRAMKARDALQSNNFLPPRIASGDHGTFGGGASDFNYLTGGPK